MHFLLTHLILWYTFCAICRCNFEKSSHLKLKKLRNTKMFPWNCCNYKTAIKIILQNNQRNLFWIQIFFKYKIFITFHYICVRKQIESWIFYNRLNRNLFIIYIYLFIGNTRALFFGNTRESHSKSLSIFSM